MAKSYYEKGSALQFQGRKDKFARYNIERDLNNINYAYGLKDGSSISTGTDEDIGTTLSALLSRIKTQGDTNIIFNITKDKNLFPAGRLKTIRGISSDSPVFATDGEGAVFADSENLSFTSKTDVINLGGKDQLRFISSDELITKDPILGDKRNVGANKETLTASTRLILQVKTTKGKILSWNKDSNEFLELDDTSKEKIGGAVLFETVDLNIFPANVSDMRNIKVNRLFQEVEILILYNVGGKLRLSLVSKNGSNPYEQKFNIELSDSDTDIRSRIVDSKDDFYYVFNKEKRTLISINKEDLTIETEVLEKDYDGIIEAEKNLVGFVRGENPNIGEENLWDNLSPKEIIDSSGYLNGFISTDGNIYKIETNIQRRLNIYNIETKVMNYIDLANAYAYSLFEDEIFIMSISDNNILLKYDKRDGTVTENTLVKDTIDQSEIEWIYPYNNKWWASYIEFDQILGGQLIVFEIDVDNLTIDKYQDNYVLDEQTFGYGQTRAIFYSSGAIAGYWNTVAPLGIASQFRRTFDIDSRTFIIAEGDGKQPNINGYSLPDKHVVCNGVNVEGARLTFLGKVGTGVNINKYIKETKTWLVKEVYVSDSGTFENINLRAFNENYVSWFDGPLGEVLVDINTAGIVPFSDPNGKTYNNSSYKFYNDFIQDKYLGTIFKNSGELGYVYQFDMNKQYVELIDKTTLRTIINTRELLNYNHEFFLNGTTTPFEVNPIFFGSGALGIVEYNNDFTNKIINRTLILPLETNVVSNVSWVSVNNDNTLDILSTPYSLINYSNLEPKEGGVEIEKTFITTWKVSTDLSVLKGSETYNFDESGVDYNMYALNQKETNGLEHRILQFGNGQLYFNGLLINNLPGQDERGGIFFEVWADTLTTEDRSIDIPSDKEITGQPIFLTRNITGTPTGAGGINHFNYNASRVDIPKFKNSENKFVTFEFLLDAAIKGVNVSYLDIDSESFLGYNQIEFLDDNDDPIPFEIANTDFETGENLSDEELLNPDLFNDGLGNQTWNIFKVYPIVNGSVIKLEFTDITTYRYYDFLKQALQNNGGISDILGDVLSVFPFLGLNPNVKRTMIPNSSYQSLSSGSGKRKFTNEFLKSMYAGTIGSQPNDASGEDFSTIDGNYGLDLSDNRFYTFKLNTVNPPERRWPFSYALMIQDSFLGQSFNIPGPLDPNPDIFYWSKPILNPKLFNEDSSHTETYLDYKNELIKGGITWNGTSFFEKFISDNGGDLTTVVKNPDVTTWNNASEEDRKYLMLMPNNFDEVLNAIKKSGVGENPQSFKTVDVTEGGIIGGLIPFRIDDMPVAEGMYSRMSQEPFTNAQDASNIGLRTNSKIRYKFLTPSTINRIRINGFGGRNWTFTQWDSNFNLSKDASGDEVIPRSIQSPNLSLKPNSAFKDILLGI